MKTLTGCFFILLFFVSGCTFNVQVLKPESSQPVPFSPQTTASPTNTFADTLVPTAEPTFTPVPPTTYPVFTNARMGSSPDDPNQPTSFPVGTKAVYAIWDYQNMREGLMVRRVWYWNGQPWITREEPWDFKKYGANGTLRDISIYDNETGLNSGAYQLRLYIDNVLQPIGSGINTPVMPWINFEIAPADSYTEYASPDFQWSAAVLNGNHLIAHDPNGSPRELYTGGEISYLAWLPDGRHILFIDRFHVDPRLGAEAGIQDVLQIVDVPSQKVNILYESDGPLGEPDISPDGRYLAISQGSGKGDACFISLRLLFFEMATDLQSAKAIEQNQFNGIPNNPDSTVYPSGTGTWLKGNEYLVPLKVTCTPDESLMGNYVFNMTGRSATRSTSGNSGIPGDLGLGRIHGKITNAITGLPVPGAAVTCEQHSYASSATCSGTTLTNAEGGYVFENIYFHDTDTINLAVQAAGYQPAQVSNTAFTTSDLEANIALNPLP